MKLQSYRAPWSYFHYVQVTLNPTIDISSLVVDWGVSLVFRGNKYIDTLEFVHCLGCHYPYWWFPQLFHHFSSLVVIQRVFFMYYLHLEHAKDAQGRWFMNMFFVRSPPNYEVPALLLVLTDERCLNALLSVSLFPSTSAHLFQIWDLEFYEYLEACSHQWQALSPLTYGNTSMPPNQWISQVFDTNSFIHICRDVLGSLIPTFIIGRLSHVS